MNKEQLRGELKYTKEKHKNDKPHTFDTDISAMCNDILDVLSRCVEIPDNATNGQIVQMMFPNASFFYHKASDIVDDYVSVCIDDCDTQQDYSMVWWDSPYQKVGSRFKKDRRNCEHRHENGNCLAVGGFCTSVNDEHCVKGDK